MRKITQEAIQALTNGYNFRSGNTTVECEEDGYRELRLHGNCIIKKEDGEWYLRSSGWETTTTKERLNGFLEYMNKSKITQKDWVWYFGSSKGQEVKSGWNKLSEV